MKGVFGIGLTFGSLVPPEAWGGEGTFSMELRYREETGEGSGRFHTYWKKAEWEAGETAIVVCDMWDSHHSVTAVRRVNELVPHLNRVLEEARRRGATIIHAPSDCMGHYEGHAARKLALGVPAADDYPKGIGAWCHRIAGEEKGIYPIDQSDGGEDESAWENAQWEAKLKAEGRKPGTPWLAQHPGLEIREGDYIAAEGEVVWNILRHRGIGHVVLAGVHTNMCVLGRPFGLRRMVEAGMETALMRDCTDLMYNPARWPYVGHFTGLDLIVEHIEARVCPTVTGDQMAGGEAFRFSQDRRPHLVVLLGEEEYGTAVTVPEFGRRFLGGDFRVSYVHAEEGGDGMPGMRLVEEADLLLVSVRRRGLSAEDMARVRRFVESGRPVLGIRTASHAFSPKGELPDGFEAWEGFDAEVFGGNYTGHHGNKEEEDPGNFARVAQEGSGHPVAEGLPEGEWKTRAWLYKTSPLEAGTQVLATGRVEGREPAEPLAWTYVRGDGGRSFYTSLGHPEDFSDPVFQRLLVNAVYWAAGLEAPGELADDPKSRRWAEGWVPVDAEGWERAAGGEGIWLRTLLRAPGELGEGARGIVWKRKGVEVYLNGEKVAEEGGRWVAPGGAWKAGELHLIAVRVPGGGAATGELPGFWDGVRVHPLKGGWQMRAVKEGEDGSRFPIPPQFGAPADLIQNWPGSAAE